MKKVQITTLCYKHLRKENQTCPKETEMTSTKERSNNIQVPDLISLVSREAGYGSNPPNIQLLKLFLFTC